MNNCSFKRMVCLSAAKLNNRSLQCGFTLIEVLIALSIISIALIAAVKASSQVTRQLVYLQDKTWALMVGESVLAETLQGQSGYRFSNQQLSGEKALHGKVFFWHLNSAPYDATTLEVQLDINTRQSTKPIVTIRRYIRENNQAY